MRIIVTEWNKRHKGASEIEVSELLELVKDHDVMLVEKDGISEVYIAAYLDKKGEGFRE